MNQENHHPSHPWGARLWVGVIILILAFVGLVVTALHPNAGWNYWRIMTVLYAVMCLWLSWYLRRAGHIFNWKKFWHEVLHWLSLWGGALITTELAINGFINYLEASFVLMTIMGIVIFLAGIHFESFLMIPGVLLAAFALSAICLKKYVYVVMLPLTIIAVVILIVYVVRKYRHPKT